MGITNFYKWIKAEYSNCIKPISDECYNHVYIDMNYLLHMCVYDCDNFDILMKKIETVVLDICIKTQPSDSLNIFCDGTSPFAKLILQRERRFNKDNNESMSHLLHFTPGTIFMKSIPDKLKKTLNTIEKQFNIEINIDVIEPGEAEIKIKNKLLENYHKNINKSHILITNDADVILILTSHESYNKCHILLKHEILSINKLINEHIKKYGKSHYSYLDFSFLNLFLGNDYLPKLYYVTNKNLWDAYKFNISLLDDSKRFLIKFNDNKIIINYTLLFDIFNTLLIKISRKKINNTDYDDDIYKNYFDGLIWNLKMYNIGICNDYYYYCKIKKPIDILNLIMYLSDKKNDYNDYNIENKPITSELCSILILPESGKELIDNKYHKFIDKINKKINIYDKKFILTKINLEFILNEFTKNL
jgi:5'-3' exonuclease